MAKPINKEKQAGATIAETVPTKPDFWHSFRLQAILLALLSIVFYANTFKHEAAFDDMMAISENQYVQQGVSGIPAILTTDAFQSYLEHKNGSNQLAGGRYRPLSLITFAIEQQLMGVAPDNESANEKEARIATQMPIRHTINVLLYALSVVVLLSLLRYIVFPQSPVAAFIAALLFAIHPLHTEVVANVKSRDEILSVLFICLTFIKAFQYYDTRNTQKLIAALVFCFLALLSKEYGVTLMVLLPLAFYIFRKATISQSLKATALYIAPLAVYFLLRTASVTEMAEGAENNVLNNPYLYATPVQKLATEIGILLQYLKLLLLPHPLIADYSYRAIPYSSFSSILVWLSLIVYLGLASAMVWFAGKRHLLGFAIAIYLGNLLLVSNLLIDIGAPMGERLIYHSSLGFCIALAWAASAWVTKSKTAIIATLGVVAVITVISAYVVIDRNKDWKNSEILFMTDVAKSPDNVLMNNNAAAGCMAQAKRTTDPALRKEWFTKAIAYFDKTIAIYPGHMLAHLNRGLSYFNMGQPYLALPDWDTVRKYNPTQPNLDKYFTIAGKYCYSEGNRLVAAGKNDSAIYVFKLGVDATPALPEMWYQLAAAYARAGDDAAALQYIERANVLSPNTPEILKLKEQIMTTGK
jgi:tetratricopeptide (TPR) repeat protein